MLLGVRKDVGVYVLPMVVIRKKRWSSRHKRRPRERRRNVLRSCRGKSMRGWRGRRFVLASL